MLASRLGIATLVLIGLGAYIALRPFGNAGLQQPKADAATMAELEFQTLLEELASAAPASNVQGPEGEQTFVLKRQADGTITVTTGAEEHTEDAARQSQPDELDGLRQDLERARDEAVAAMAGYDRAQSAYVEAGKATETPTETPPERSTESPVAEAANSSPEFDKTLDDIELALRAVDAQAEAEQMQAEQVEELDSQAEEPAKALEEAQKLGQLLDRWKGAASDVPEEDLSGKVLMGRDFSNQNLAGINLRRAVLTGAKFDGANLTGADLGGAKLQGATFTETNLIDANLTGVSAQAARFQGADLRRANLENANFTGTDLTNADLRGAATKKLILNGSVRQGALFDGQLGAPAPPLSPDPSPPIE